MSGPMPQALAAGVSAEIRRAALAQCQAITRNGRERAAEEAWRGIDWQYRLMLVSFLLPHLDGSRVVHRPWAEFTDEQRRTLAHAVLRLGQQAGEAAPRLRA